MSDSSRNWLSRAGITIGFLVSLLLALQLLEARFLQPIRDCQKDQETRLRVLEAAIYRQTPVLEALGHRLGLDLPLK